MLSGLTLVNTVCKINLCYQQTTKSSVAGNISGRIVAIQGSKYRCMVLGLRIIEILFLDDSIYNMVNRYVNDIDNYYPYQYRF